jgi:hypothetical protein
VEAAFEYRADSGGIADGEHEPVTVVRYGPSTSEPDSFFDGVPSAIADQVKESAHHPGPGGIPINLDAGALATPLGPP